MIAVLQRVKRAAVSVEGNVVGECKEGLCILLGVAKGDGEEDARALAEKTVNLRIFSDENGKMNLSLKDIDGEALVISQFTLMANYSHGNRPDFLEAESPDKANALYEYVLDGLLKQNLVVKKGVFGADMKISQINDGPFTVILEK